MPETEKSVRWLQSMCLDRNADASGSSGGEVEAKRFHSMAFTNTIRFVRALSRPALSAQSVLRQVLPIGRVAMSNVSRSQECRASHTTDLVASLRLLFSRASVLRDFSLNAVFRVTGSLGSIVDDCQSTGKTLALLSAHGHGYRDVSSSMLASEKPNYQNNYLRSSVPRWLSDRSKKKIIQDEKERNVDQRVAIGRMPNCDR